MYTYTYMHTDTDARTHAHTHTHTLGDAQKKWTHSAPSALCLGPGSDTSTSSERSSGSVMGFIQTFQDMMRLFFSFFCSEFFFVQSSSGVVARFVLMLQDVTYV